MSDERLIRVKVGDRFPSDDGTECQLFIGDWMHGSFRVSDLDAATVKVPEDVEEAIDAFGAQRANGALEEHYPVTDPANDADSAAKGLGSHVESQKMKDALVHELTTPAQSTADRIALAILDDAETQAQIDEHDDGTVINVLCLVMDEIVLYVRRGIFDDPDDLSLQAERRKGEGTTWGMGQISPPVAALCRAKYDELRKEQA